LTTCPTPEEVIKVKRKGLEELFLLVLGPGIIALGLAIGSGEWLLGSLVVGGYRVENRLANLSVLYSFI
jgi:hypothetical protein